MKLTQYHIDILEHRLDVPDCIVEAIEGYTLDEIQERCSSLLKKIKQEKELGIASLSGIEVAILTDCLEGSTFFASTEDEIADGQLTRYKANKYYEAADELGKEFNCVCTTC